MLAAALWRNAGGGAFHQLQQSLLNTLTRHVAGNGGIFRLAADLVDLVDIDNATLRLFDIIVTGLQELQDNVFHILTDIARFRQRRCIRHGERHIKGLRSEEHTSELQSLMRISYAVFCLKKKKKHKK